MFRGSGGQKGSEEKGRIQCVILELLNRQGYIGKR